MSIYSDACYDIALGYIAEHDALGHAFNAYVTSRELGEWAARERSRFDPEHAERYGGSRKAWDEKVWRIARDAWEDAMEGAPA